MSRSVGNRLLVLVVAAVLAAPFAAQDTDDETEKFATLTLTFTNNGLPLTEPERGKFYVYEVDKRDSYVAWGHETRVAEFPEGTYDLLIRYENGEVEETITRSEVEFEGEVEETIDFNVQVAHLRVDITRGGVTVEPFTGSYSVYSRGRRDQPIVRKRPGTEITIRPGTYDIEVAHRGPGGMKTTWVESVLVDGSVQETVELGLSQDQIAHLTLTMLEDGRRIPPEEGVWRVFNVGERRSPVAERRSGEMLGIEKGIYDIGAVVTRDGQRRERWINGVTLEGDFEREIEMGLPMASLRVNINDGARPLPAAWCSVYEVGQRDHPLASAQSGETVQIEPGIYDIGCFLREDGLRADDWVQRRRIRGSDTLDIELTHRDAFLTVLPRGGWRWGRGDEDPARLLILLDSSSRMRARTDEGSRLEVALRAVASALGSRPGELEVGLRTVGGDPDGTRECRASALVAPPAQANEEALSTALAGLLAAGAAPLAIALEQVVEDLPPGPGNTLVLITAGADACGGNLCSAASRLLRDGIVGRIFVIGLDVERDQLRRLDCVGEQRVARNTAELTGAIRDVIAQTTSTEDGTFSVFRPGRPAVWVAGGAVGNKIKLNEGTYDIQIHSRGKTYTWDAVQVDGDFEAVAGRRPRRR